MTTADQKFDPPICLGCGAVGEMIDGRICQSCANSAQGDPERAGYLSALGQIPSPCKQCGRVSRNVGGLCDPCWEAKKTQNGDIEEARIQANPAESAEDFIWRRFCSGACRVRDRATFRAEFERDWYSKKAWDAEISIRKHGFRFPFSLLVAGDAGKGKTWLLAQYYSNILDSGGRPFWVDSHTLWRLAAKNEKPPAWAATPYLFIDDLGAEAANTPREMAQMEAFLHNLGNQRGAKVTVVSANYKPIKFEEIYGARVVERLAKMSLSDETSRFFIQQRGLLKPKEDPGE